MRGAAEQLAAVRAFAADAGLAHEDLAADVVEAHLEVVQLGVDPRQPGELRLAQAAVRLGLDVVRGAVQFVDEAAEIAQQQLARGPQERDAAAQLPRRALVGVAAASSSGSSPAGRSATGTGATGSAP